jgi:hypothetical protein
MLKRETEPCSQLGFQLNTYGMDLSEYTFLDEFYAINYCVWYNLYC